MLREEVGPLTAQHERLIIVLDVARIEAFVQMWPGLPGRPLEDRHALARAFVAKAVLDLPTTSGLIERLAVDAVLRRLCGFERASEVPSESTFSRAFADFAASALPSLSASPDISLSNVWAFPTAVVANQHHNNAEISFFTVAFLA